MSSGDAGFRKLSCAVLVFIELALQAESTPEKKQNPSSTLRLNLDLSI